MASKPSSASGSTSRRSSDSAESHSPPGPKSQSRKRERVEADGVVPCLRQQRRQHRADVAVVAGHEHAHQSHTVAAITEVPPVIRSQATVFCT